MTRNQIEYYKARTGRLELEEAIRHNLVGETVSMNNYTLGVRGQEEVERHNRVVEGQSLMSINVARQQAAASMLGAQASMAGAAAAARNAEAAMLNAQTNKELLPFQQAAEQSRSSMYEAQRSGYIQDAINQRISNQYAGERNQSEIDRINAQSEQAKAQAYYSITAANNLGVINDITQRGQDLQFASSMADAFNDMARNAINAERYLGQNNQPEPFPWR